MTIGVWNTKTSKLLKIGEREKNEDSLGFEVGENWGCWVIADGLGGHEGGEVSSKIAVETIIDTVKSNGTVAEMLEPSIITAHLKIQEEQKKNNNLNSMRTTVVALFQDHNSLVCGHIGDSRCYYFRSGKVVCQTKDHSVSQAMVSAGELAPSQLRHHEDRNRLLRVLGTKGNIRPSISDKWLCQNNDAFLLCTDGFWEHVTESEMETHLMCVDSPEEWLKRMEKTLLEKVKENYDNYSAIAVFMDEIP